MVTVAPSKKGHVWIRREADGAQEEVAFETLKNLFLTESPPGM